MPRRRVGRGQITRPFDATTKHLLESGPDTWLGYVGLKIDGPVTAIDADLSMVLAEADKVLHVADPSPWLVHVELQASYDSTIPARLHQYSALLHRRHAVPVASVVVLLRPEADGPALDGTFTLAWPGERGPERYLTFTYDVVRAWQQSAEAVLSGGLATLPMAPLANIAPDELPEVIRRMGERIEREAAPSEAATLWAATYVLMGLRYPPETAEALLQGVRAMHESTTYQAILREGEALGRADQTRRLLLRLGAKRLGPPDRRTTATLSNVLDVERIERMTESLFDATSWDDVLATQ